MKKSLNNLADFLESGLYALVEGKSVKCSKIQQKIFSGSLLKQNSYDHMTFVDCVFYACELQQLSFAKCKFVNCTFKFCHIDESIFAGCKFVGCSWLGNRFQGCVAKFCFMDEATLAQWCEMEGLEMEFGFCQAEHLMADTETSVDYDEWLPEIDGAIWQQLDELVANVQGK